MTSQGHSELTLWDPSRAEGSRGDEQSRGGPWQRRKGGGSLGAPKGANQPHNISMTDGSVQNGVDANPHVGGWR